MEESRINKNKKLFLDLVNAISEERLDSEHKQRLVEYLESSDFFTAPASTKYHSSHEGGLCAHSLTVYSALESLVEQFTDGEFSEDSLKIVALFHDISKANYYESYLRNVKNDITGQWEKVPEYRVKSADDRLIVGNHEQTSEYILRRFIRLTPEESVAILHHHGGMGHDCSQVDMSVIFSKYPLALLLHTADMFGAYMFEKNEN